MDLPNYSQDQIKIIPIISGSYLFSKKYLKEKVFLLIIKSK